MKRTLTDRGLKALKPAEKGKTYDRMDGVVPGLGVRVSETGRSTFVLVARFPGSSNPTRRALGAYGELTLEGARARARQWLDLIRRGIDPREQEERERRANAEQRKNTFAAVAADFVAEKLPAERRGDEVKRDIERELLPSWGGRPISEITDLDVLAVVKAKLQQGSPVAARNLLALIKRLFSWAVDQRVYGLARSPAVDIRPTPTVGDKTPRERTLSDQEMFALWRAAGRIGYPTGAVYKVLALTALRLNEVADAEWSEFDLKERIWNIPGSRMKARNSKARPHAVPLTDDLLAIFNGLPRFSNGRFVFSARPGKPVWMTNKVKRRVDARMLLTLRALARLRGEDPKAVALPEWTNHDIRRTCRTHFSRLRISEEAREALLAHTRPGIKGVYDRYDYLDEKREAMMLWAARLRSIVEPATDNVVALRAVQ